MSGFLSPGLRNVSYKNELAFLITTFIGWSLRLTVGLRMAFPSASTVFGLNIFFSD
jgi:hypothetical protein